MTYIPEIPVKKIITIYLKTLVVILLIIAGVCVLIK